MSHHKRPAAVARAEALLATMRRGQRRNTIPGLDALDTYLIATHSDLTVPQQAAALGSSRGLLHYWRKQLYDRGLLDRQLRASHTPLTDAEAQAIAGLWHDGWSRAAIAAARDIAESRVARALLRAGVTGVTPRRVTLRLVDLGRIFTIDAQSIGYWLREGWLVDNRPLSRPGSPHSWDYDDLIALIRTRDSWVAWAPTQIADPQLRRLAEHERAAADGAWFAMSMIADILGIALSTLSTWRTRLGLFAALPAYRWAGSRFVWLTRSQAAELEAWGADVRRHRPGANAHRWAANALQQRLTATYGHSRSTSAAAD